MHCSSKWHYETYAKLTLTSGIQIKQELSLNHHWMLFPKTKPRAGKFSKANPSLTSHLSLCARPLWQKELPRWAWGSPAELFSATSHSSIPLLQCGAFMTPASFPSAAKYIKQAGRDQ